VLWVEEGGEIALDFFRGVDRDICNFAGDKLQLEYHEDFIMKKKYPMR